MSTKLTRWIDLLAALLARRYPASFEELSRDVPAYARDSQAFETRRRMFERDKDELREFGVPIETTAHPTAEQGYQLSTTSFYLPYLTLLSAGRTSRPRRADRYGYRSLETLCFEPDELIAIAAAFERVRALGISALTADAASAARKLGYDLPLAQFAASADTTQVLRQNRATDEALFGLLTEALQTRKRVSFVYHSIGRNETARRTVEPAGLFFLNGHWYLAATQPGEPVKNYRLSRISQAEMNARQPGTPDYALPPDFVLRDHARSRQAWELGSGDVLLATVKIIRSTGAAVAATRLGQPVEGDASHRIFQVRRPDAFARWLLGFAGAVIPVDPPELVADFTRLVHETLARCLDPEPP